MSNSTKQIDLHITGMSCQHCVDAVEGALAAVDGAHVEEVGIGRARVRYEPGRTSTAQLTEAVEEAGYDVRDTERIA